MLLRCLYLSTFDCGITFFSITFGQTMSMWVDMNIDVTGIAYFGKNVVKCNSWCENYMTWHAVLNSGILLVGGSYYLILFVSPF